LSLITLGVRDVSRAQAFYEALGWRIGGGADDDTDNIAFFQAGGFILALWDRAQLERDSGVEDTGGWGGVTLALNVRSPEEVDAVLAEAEEAGATIARSGGATFWGGYSGSSSIPTANPGRWRTIRTGLCTRTPDNARLRPGGKAQPETDVACEHIHVEGSGEDCSSRHGSFRLVSELRGEHAQRNAKTGQPFLRHACAGLDRLRFHVVPSWSDVIALGLAFPGVELGTSYGTPALRVRKALLCRLRTDPDALVLRVIDIGERKALMQGQPDVFFSTPHYDGYPYVLVRLDVVNSGELAELIEEIWRSRRAQAPRRRVRRDQIAPGLLVLSSEHATTHCPDWRRAPRAAKDASQGRGSFDDALVTELLRTGIARNETEARVLARLRTSELRVVLAWKGGSPPATRSSVQQEAWVAPRARL